jgi:hypothetical protein
MERDWSWWHTLAVQEDFLNPTLALLVLFFLVLLISGAQANSTFPKEPPLVILQEFTFQITSLTCQKVIEAKSNILSFL